MESLKVRLARVNAGSLTLTPVTLEELKSALNAMSSKKYCIQGDIPIKILKVSFGVSGRSLLRIVNASVVQKTVPESWKDTEIIPIYKRNDPSDPGNFSPIAIVLGICKIIEKSYLHIQ